MGLSDEYRRQLAWRSWPEVFAALPPVSGRTVLDLGCAVGDQAAELVGRGARVIGVDANPGLLRVARSRGLQDARFVQADLRRLDGVLGPVDGVWCSFAAAYFPDLSSVLDTWKAHLRPGGWVALTEIDDLFGHGPLGERSRVLLDEYVRRSRSAGLYDFLMGRRLADHVQRAGFTVSRVFTVDDHELAFQGGARPGVVDAWRQRFERMTLLQEFCAAEFASVRDEFLQCLTRPDHRSTARVWVCVATCVRPG